ncbi:MAG: (2Fe-2S) ferredoxin domain-containing protein [Endomicrobiaceae bacterium]|nr:(2Fe-2S) ferredoxin domain-containing protein [Endomicrobiaceae bacterium]
MTSPLTVLAAKKQQAKNNLEKIGYFSDVKVYVGMATCEIAAGSNHVMEVFQNAIKEDKSLKNVYLSQKGCVGRCNLEPTVEIYQKGQEPVKYIKVTAENAKVIIEKHIKKGEVIKEWVGK